MRRTSKRSLIHLHRGTRISLADVHSLVLFVDRCHGAAAADGVVANRKRSRGTPTTAHCSNSIRSLPRQRRWRKRPAANGRAHYISEPIEDGACSVLLIPGHRLLPWPASFRILIGIVTLILSTLLHLSRKFATHSGGPLCDKLPLPSGPPRPRRHRRLDKSPATASRQEMNGSQLAEGQKPPLASGESSNGSSLLAKKRKKDGLKPIITTTEGGQPPQDNDDDDDEQAQPGPPG